MSFLDNSLAYSTKTSILFYQIGTFWITGVFWIQIFESFSKLLVLVQVTPRCGYSGVGDIIMLVTLGWLKSVSNISKSSPRHFVTNIQCCWPKWPSQSPTVNNSSFTFSIITIFVAQNSLIRVGNINRVRKFKLTISDKSNLRALTVN